MQLQPLLKEEFSYFSSLSPPSVSWAIKVEIIYQCHQLLLTLLLLCFKPEYSSSCWEYVSCLKAAGSLIATSEVDFLGLSVTWVYGLFIFCRNNLICRLYLFFCCCIRYFFHCSIIKCVPSILGIVLNNCLFPNISRPIRNLELLLSSMTVLQLYSFSKVWNICHYNSLSHSHSVKFNSNWWLVWGNADAQVVIDEGIS